MLLDVKGKVGGLGHNREHFGRRYWLSGLKVVVRREQVGERGGWVLRSGLTPKL